MEPIPCAVAAGGRGGGGLSSLHVVLLSAFGACDAWQCARNLGGSGSAVMWAVLVEGLSLSFFFESGHCAW